MGYDTVTVFFDVVSNDEFCVLHLFAFLCLFFRNFVLTGKREELRLLFVTQPMAYVSEDL